MQRLDQDGTASSSFVPTTSSAAARAAGWALRDGVGPAGPLRASGRRWACRRSRRPRRPRCRASAATSASPVALVTPGAAISSSPIEDECVIVARSPSSVVGRARGTRRRRAPWSLASSFSSRSVDDLGERRRSRGAGIGLPRRSCVGIDRPSRARSRLRRRSRRRTRPRSSTAGNRARTSAASSHVRRRVRACARARSARSCRS